MTKNICKILHLGTAVLFFLLVLAGAFNNTIFHQLGSSRAFADHYEPDYANVNDGCSKDGKITLDASRSSVLNSGTVWSNTSLINGESAKKNINVGLKSDSGISTIINATGSDGQLAETTTEFNTSTYTYTNLEHPDYTGGLDPLSYFSNPTGQLFDFGRYKAAATATNNTLTYAEFEAKVQNNEQMHGIVYVTLDANEGTKKLESGSVNVKGPWVINLINGTPSYKMFVKVPLNVNPVISPTTHTTTLSPTDFDNWTSVAAARTNTSDPFPWPSGYASGWSDVTAYASGSKDPRGKTLTGYESFGPYEDMPALMYSGGIVDIHHEANVSGVVYTPDFVEIEQKKKNNEVQYINGAVFAGNGIFLESNTCSGGIGVVYDPDTLDNLKVTPIPSAMIKASLAIN
jgi:hypothetical protein